MSWTQEDAAKMDAAANEADVELREILNSSTSEELDATLFFIRFHMKWGRGPAGYKRLAKKYAAILAEYADHMANWDK